MKKNKGFSLVELIIVIAIMAILAAAIAPALIRYIDKSRRADDVTAAGSINSAMSAALANEAAYDEIMSVSDGTILLQAAAGAATWDSPTSGAYPTLIKEMNSSQQPPKIKYKKAVATTVNDATKLGSGSFDPAGWAVAISGGKPIVYVTGSTYANGVMLQPSINDEYK
jgi:type IV pilus assembly protein PilA